MMDGIIVVNKPSGMTSHDVVSRARRILRMRQIGHAGTLDPLATGVLVLLVGKGTKLFKKFEAFDKAYRASLILGTRTTTADVEGETIEQMPFSHISQQDILETFKQFIGEIQQTPPMVSAIKVNGRRLYELARKGIEVERQARQVRIDALNLLEFHSPRVRFYLECSKGTYVRKLAEDVGERLGCGACIAEIERTKVGPFKIEDAVTLDELNETHLQSWKD
jgi:tRNA pseudouridine55 synthase